MDFSRRYRPGPLTEAEFFAQMKFLDCYIAYLKIQYYTQLLLEEEDAKQKQQAQQQQSLRRRRKIIAKRKFYTRPWFKEDERYGFGQYYQLLPQLKAHDGATYRYFLRMEPEMFNDILQRIRPRIQKQDTNFKKAIGAGLKLACTLRFLGTGETYRSLALGFRVGPNTISKFVPEVCEAIVEEYLKEEIVLPETPEQWKQVADGFSTKWQFHHVLGAIDGKHIAIQAPASSGSFFHNYKGYFSIVLLALVDAEGRFIYIDVGANGSASDGGVFKETALRDALERKQAGVPEDEPLPGETRPVPYFIVGDNAFPMRWWLQKPHPTRGLTPAQRNFNYRLSRARRIVENAFGMFAQRFRVFLTTINVLPKTVEKMVFASCILHNMLRNKSPNLYPLPDMDSDTPSGTWQVDPLDGLSPNPRQSGPRHAKEIREYLTEFYSRPSQRLHFPSRPSQHAEEEEEEEEEEEAS